MVKSTRWKMRVLRPEWEANSQVGSLESARMKSRTREGSETGRFALRHFHDISAKVLSIETTARLGNALTTILMSESSVCFELINSSRAYPALVFS